MLFWLQSAIMLKSVGEDFGNLQMTDLEKRITSCLLHHTQTGVHPSVSHVHLHLCNVYTASSAKHMWTIGHDDWSWEGKALSSLWHSEPKLELLHVCALFNHLPTAEYVFTVQTPQLPQQSIWWLILRRLGLGAVFFVSLKLPAGKGKPRLF